MTSSAGTWRVLRHPPFRNLWLGQLVSAIGDYFYFLAVPIAVNRMTGGSTLAVGLATISFFLPQILFGLFAGVLVDRWDRRRTMIATDLFRAFVVLGALLVYLTDQLWIFYLVSFLISTASRFFFPAQMAVIPLIVEEEDLLAANGLNQVTMTAGMLIGPALAGLLIGSVGEPVAFVADAISYLFSAAMIFTIRVPRTNGVSVAEGQSTQVLWEDLKRGLRFLFSNRTLVGLVISVAVVQLGVGAINVLWVPFLDRYFGAGPWEMGLVDALQGVGMALGGIAVGALSDRFEKRWIGAVGIAVIGLAIAGMGVSPALILIFLFAVLIGLALTPAQAALTTVLQMVVPDALMGRVNGAFGTFVTTASLVSMAVAAVLGDLIGLRVLYTVAGLIVALAGGLTLSLVEEPGTAAISVHNLPEAP